MPRPTKNNHWRYQGEDVVKKCMFCGKIFRMRPGLAKKWDKKFCSKQCASKYSVGKSTGSKNPNWKGGITPVYDLIRSSVKMHNWVLGVFKRDGFKCVRCGDSKGGNLNAHHKKLFSVLLSEAILIFKTMNQYDAAMSYSPLWDLGNGETLCVDCHKIEHKKRGAK